MNTNSFANKIMIFLMLLLFLSACSNSPATTLETPPIEASATEIVSTATTAPPTATSVPPTATSVPPTATTVPPTATEVPTATSAPVGEGEIKVMAAFVQVDRGLIPWVDDFVAKTGCKVTLEDFIDYDQALDLINGRGIDVVVAGGSSGRLIASGLMEEIDVSKVPSWENIDPLATSAAWNSADGQYYGVPYLWIPYVLMYDTEVFPTPPTSWDVVFTEQTLPDGLSNKERVLAPYTAVYIGDAAKYLMSANPEAGITNPYQLNGSQFSMALELLYQQRQILGAYWGYDEPMMDFGTNGYAVSASMPRVVKLMSTAGIPVSSTIPQEGATTSAFTNMLVKNAPHPVCAYQWMEYSLDAKVQGDSAATLGANPFVAAACEGASELLSAEDCERNGFYRFSEFHNVQLPTSDCGNGQENCIAMDRWVTEFTSLTNP